MPRKTTTPAHTDLDALRQMRSALAHCLQDHGAIETTDHSRMTR